MTFLNGLKMKGLLNIYAVLGTGKISSMLGLMMILS